MGNRDDCPTTNCVNCGQHICKKEEGNAFKQLQSQLADSRWIPVEERMPIDEKVYEIFDIVRGTAGFSLFQKPANKNPWRSTKALGEIRTITHWREVNPPKEEK